MSSDSTQTSTPQPPQHTAIPLYRVHTPINSKFLQSQLSQAAPDYILSTITPSPSHIRQIQHLYDISFPIRYTSKFYDKLAKPDQPLNRTFQSQTLILTSTPPNKDSDTAPLSNQHGLVGTVKAPKALPKSTIRLHSSLLNPNPYDIMTLVKYNKLPKHPSDQTDPASQSGQEQEQKSNSIFDAVWGKDALESESGDVHVEYDPLLLTEARVYGEEYKSIGIPEYQTFSTTTTTTPAVEHPSANHQDYLHTVINPPHIDATTQPYHQVIGSWVARPAEQSLTSLFSDAIYTAQTSIAPVISSVSSWFSSTFSTTAQPTATTPTPASTPSTTLIPPQPLRSCYLCTLAIAPQFQSTGFGSLLLFNCIEFVKKNYQSETIYLHVLESSRASIDFYKHFGFTVEGCIQHYFPLSQLHRTTNLSKHNSLLFEEQRERELLRKQQLHQKQRQEASLNGSSAAIVMETDLDEIDETDDAVSPSQNHTEDTSINQLDGVALDITGQPIKQSYLIAENETGNALSMCLDIAKWDTTYRAIILAWLQAKLSLEWQPMIA